VVVFHIVLLFNCKKKLEHEVAIVFLEWKICIHSQYCDSFFCLFGGEAGCKGKQKRIERISD